ncbi:flavin-containing monooxygenase FMO GS-OX5-like [Bidens hawaiensis]|uniref:flavin-containing monooxygenase FMO GS-OX5-like n=1 Tax=Bidens hawaiensis TaxID=980011 RepID=UPI0040498B10
MANSLKVAVIGAGVSGLVAARELLRENHQVTVFEKLDQVGGTWVYDDRVEDGHCLDLDPNRSIVHSSIYASLRTNLPRPLMGYSDFKFEDKSYGDPRLFPGHVEVLKFLQDFANEFGVTKVIQFKSEVVRVEESGDHDQFVVEWRTMEDRSEEGVFDAVVVCNGHNTEPRVADDVPGIKEWSRKQLHSHNYRIPEPYQDQVVVIIGNGASASDISREIATTAKEVHLSTRSSDVKVTKLDGYRNIWQHMKINHVFDNGAVEFEDGDSIIADAIIHCTGYKVHFPFLRSNNMVNVDDNCVGPLYKHVFLPQHAPRLAFIGLNSHHGIFYRLAELQAKWVALSLSAKISLPSKDEMLADVYKLYQEMDQNGIPKRYTHSLRFQYEYVDWLAEQVDLHVEDELKKTVNTLIGNISAPPNGYRDTWVL